MQIEDHFRINVTIPFIEEVIGCLQDRFSEDQQSIMKGVMLLPSSVITEPNWVSVIQPFLQFYNDDIPFLVLLIQSLSCGRKSGLRNGAYTVTTASTLIHRNELDT